MKAVHPATVTLYIINCWAAQELNGLLNTFPPALKFPITSTGFIRKINNVPVWIFLRFVTYKFMSHCDGEMSGSVEIRWLVARLWGGGGLPLA